MAWITPKTNWSAADGVTASDMNRIESNELHLNAETLVDANAPTALSCFYDSNTLNTPYKAGLTASSQGRIYSIRVGATWNQQLCICNGGNVLFMRYVADSAWSAWSKATDGGNADTVDNLHSVDITKRFEMGGTKPDVNNLISDGIYYNIGNASENAPDGDWGTVYVSYIAHAMWIQQLWISQMGRMYLRHSTDSGAYRTWSAWQQIITSTNYHTYSDAYGIHKIGMTPVDAGVGVPMEVGAILMVYE